MDSGPSTSLKTRPEVEYPTSWKNLVDAQFEENHSQLPSSPSQSYHLFPVANMADLKAHRLLTPAVEIGLEALSNFIAPGFAPSM